MLTYTNQIDNYKDFTKNSSTDNTTRGTTLINEGIRKICRLTAWKFLEGSKDITLVDGTQFYDVAFDFGSLIDTYTTVGTQRYVPKKCPDRKTWDLINESTSYKATYPEWYFQFGGKIGFSPIPSTANTATINYKKRIRDIGTADYTTGTISVANDDATVTGSGTTFTASMVGRWIKMPNGDWYEIGSFTSTTSIELVNSYDGADASGQSYTIGEVSVLPEGYQLLPILWAARVYWYGIGNNSNKAIDYDNQFKEGLSEMLKEYSDNDTSPVLDEGLYEITYPNPNLFVTL